MLALQPGKALGPFELGQSFFNILNILRTERYLPHSSSTTTTNPTTSSSSNHPPGHGSGGGSISASSGPLGTSPNLGLIRGGGSGGVGIEGLAGGGDGGASAGGGGTMFKRVNISWSQTTPSTTSLLVSVPSSDSVDNSHPPSPPPSTTTSTPSSSAPPLILTFHGPTQRLIRIEVTERPDRWVCYKGNRFVGGGSGNAQGGEEGIKRVYKLLGPTYTPESHPTIPNTEVISFPGVAFAYDKGGSGGDSAPHLTRLYITHDVSNLPKSSQIAFPQSPLLDLDEEDQDREEEERGQIGRTRSPPTTQEAYLKPWINPSPECAMGDLERVEVVLSSPPHLTLHFHSPPHPLTTSSPHQTYPSSSPSTSPSSQFRGGGLATGEMRETMMIPPIEIEIGITSTEDLMCGLGAPVRTFWKEDNRMQIHDPISSHGPEAELEPNAYFFNYPTLGLDFMIHPVRHVVVKIIFHSNLPGEVNFGRYARCRWRIRRAGLSESEMERERGVADCDKISTIASYVSAYSSPLSDSDHVPSPSHHLPPTGPTPTPSLPIPIPSASTTSNPRMLTPSPSPNHHQTSTSPMAQVNLDSPVGSSSSPTSVPAISTGSSGGGRGKQSRKKGKGSSGVPIASSEASTSPGGGSNAIAGSSGRPGAFIHRDVFEDEDNERERGRGQGGAETGRRAAEEAAERELDVIQAPMDLHRGADAEPGLKNARNTKAYGFPGVIFETTQEGDVETVWII